MQTSDPYAEWLGRDGTESQRLNSQHDLITHTIGYLAHPELKGSLGPEAKIAELATGTGVVLTELAKTLPATCQLEGFDISDAQFPAVADLPSNLRFYVADARKPFPSEHNHKYDAVLIRYINAALSIPDWEAVAKNVQAILKPGGILQWIEADFLQAIRWLRRDSSIPIPISKMLADRVAAPMGHLEWGLRNLREILGRVGFEDVIQDIYGTDRIPEHRTAWTINTAEVLETVWRRIEAFKGSDGFSPEELTKLMAQLQTEARTAAYSRYDIHVFLGRKSQSSDS